MPGILARKGIVFCTYFFFENRVFVAQAVVKLVILLPQFPQYWDYRYVAPYSDPSIFWSIKLE
jgi:hypothetical protein